jgi:hypothetical protein
VKSKHITARASTDGDADQDQGSNLGVPTTKRMRETLLHLQRAVSDALLELEVTPANETSVPPRAMTIGRYAEHRAVSVRTVYRWVRLGLPVERRGKVTRVVVAAADAWDERAAIARDADVSASGARTG